MAQVLVNPDSGLAETFEPDIAQQKLQAGYHIPLHDTEGKEFSAPFDEATRLVQEGSFRQPTPEELNLWVHKGKFGTAGQQALSFIEGATKGIAGPLSPLVENKVFGIPYENIEARKEVNPGTHLAGEVAGTAAGVLVPGLAEASLPGIIAKAGKAAEAGIAAEGAFGAIAKKAVSGSIEGSLYELNNKIHEGVLGNPQAVSEYALADIGVSAALSGGLNAAFGAAAPWMKRLTDEGTAGAARLVNKLADADTYEKKQALDWMTNTAALAGIGHMIGGPVGSAVGTGIAAVKGGMKGFKYLAKNNRDQLLDGLMSLNTAVARGVDQIDKHSGSIFGLGSSEIPKVEHSTELHELHEPVQDIQVNPSQLIDTMTKGTEGINPIAPMISSSLSERVGSAVNFLEGARPKIDKKAPLDMEPEIPHHQIANFNQVADVVDNPMMVFGHIKEGTLLPQHIAALQNVYPSIYSQMQSSIMDKMTDYLAKKDPETIPYKTKLSLSQFLGQPLESSLTPLAILGNQQVLTAQAQEKNASQMNQMRPSKSGMEKMKSLDNSMTRSQRSSVRR